MELCWLFHCKNVVFLFLVTSKASSQAISPSLSRVVTNGVAYANFVPHEFHYLNITILGAAPVSKGSECGLACVNTLPCFSFNLAASPDINGRLLCELLPSDKYNNSDKFVSSQIFHHYSIPSQCSSGPCQNNGACVPKYEQNSYICVCTAVYIGKNCETVSFDLRFTRKTISDYVIHHGLEITDAFTTCFRIRTTDTSNYGGVVVSYSNTQHTNEILIGKFSQITIRINNKLSETQVSANDGKWRHICLSWENQAGAWKLYKDGDEQTSGTGRKVGHVIKTGGILVIGQDQDSHGGGFDADQSFVGDLTDLNIWSRVLPAQDILSLSKSCSGGRGNVKK